MKVLPRTESASRSPSAAHDDGDLGERGTPAVATHDQAEHYEYLRQAPKRCAN